MAVVTSYTDTVREILSRVAGHLKRIPKPDVETLLIEDVSQGAFLLKRLGWHARERVNTVVIFARVRDGRVWIEDDNTDLSFYDELVAAGVPRSDIVLAFHPPEMRRFTDSAVA
jgi:XisI protein